MSSDSSSRRSFLGHAATLGTVPLIGTALAAGPFQTKSAPKTQGGKAVVIPTHEQAGNLDERLDFPPGWDVQVMNMAGYNQPVLTPKQLAEQMSQPIGTKPLRELAEGKKRVVITFDDLTRTTPTHAMVPWVLGELEAAGLQPENILFLGSFGTHRCMTAEEIRTKLGKDIATRYAWMNHNVFDCLKEVGTTTYKNKILLNQTFMGADLKVCLSGIKVHYDAGYGGGAKAVLPGVAGLPSIEYNHQVILPAARRANNCGPVRIFKNDMRLDLIEAARMASVDYTVQLIYNQKLRPLRAFAGDIVEAHHAAVRVAAKTYCTPTAKDADIVVANAYPQNAQPYHGGRWIGLSVKPGGTGVLIIQHPLGYDPIHYLNNKVAGARGGTYWDLHRRAPGRNPRGSHLIVYSQYMSRTMMDNYGTDTDFCTKWTDVVKILRERHKGTGVKVAVYPYAGMQHQEIELDG
ncbi:MAG: lactate racemase domain-containing protein [Acidobacteriia bacterium]|nr:lactate racemase domain-containing protein [Terriglobia bacterium]